MCPRIAVILTNWSRDSDASRPGRIPRGTLDVAAQEEAMRIKFVEVQNFRKLRSIRIDFSDKATLLVGANNSGKTSAMLALGHFLVDRHRFTANDFTLSHWAAINR